ncbi:MAG: SNF2 helicase associated domain-containing protein, partial [Clostridia bacterium]|nr:SNF2 helicase associated domain-containing protein [Clostridia bacterium]
MLPLKRISELADNHPVYLRGVAAYNAGRVTHISRQTHPFYAEYITATVKENATLSHETELGISPEEQVEYKRCDCSTHQRTGGFCKHLVAVLVHKYYADMLGGLPERKTDASVSDPAVTHMLDRFVRRQDLAPASRQIRLEPTLHLNPRRASLSFILRDSRPYILRDIGAFCEAVRRHSTVEYGNQLRFCHEPEQFAPSSRPLLSFLLRHFEEQRTALVENGSAPGARFLRELPLSGSALDEFFTLFAGERVECALGGESALCLFAETDPPITIQAASNEKGYTFTSEKLSVIRGDAHLYLLFGDSFCRCSPAYTTAVAELLTALQAGRGRLFVANADLPLFCAAVCETAIPYIRAEGRWPNAAEHPLPEPSITVYLDAEGPSRITARAELDYNDVKVNPYTDEHSDLPRNRPLEHRLSTLLQSYFPSFDPENGCLTMQGEDEELFRFLLDGVRELNELGEVLVTDRVRHIGPAEPPKVSVGVRVENQLLQVDWSMADTSPAELAAILRQYRLKKTYYRLKDGRFLLLRDPELSALSQLAAGLALTDKELSRGQIQLPAYRALYLDKVAADNPSLTFARDTAFRRICDRFDAFAGDTPQPPASLRSVLRD